LEGHFPSLALPNRQLQGNYPEGRIQHSEHGESLKSRKDKAVGKIRKKERRKEAVKTLTISITLVNYVLLGSH